MSRHKFAPELKEAKEVFEAAKADPKKRRLIEEREDAIRNYAAAMSQAREEGVEAGKAEGEKIGIEKGKAEGENKKAIEVAKKMLSDGLPVDLVAKYSGLSLQEVKKINIKSGD